MKAPDGTETKAKPIATRAKVKSVMESRRDTAKALIELKDSIQPLLLALPPQVEEVRPKHLRWLQEYEQFLIHHGEYLALVMEDQRPTVQSELEPELSSFQDFKATLDQSLVYHTSRLDRDSIWRARSHTSRFAGSRISSSLSIARAMEQQKTAELLARTQALREKGKLEEERLHFQSRKNEEELRLRQKEEELELRTELHVASAKAAILDELEQSEIRDEQNLSGFPLLSSRIPSPLGVTFSPAAPEFVPVPSQFTSSFTVPPQAQANGQPGTQFLDTTCLTDVPTSTENNPSEQALIQETKEPKIEKVADTDKMEQKVQVLTGRSSDVQNSKGQNPSVESTISVAQHLIQEIRKPSSDLTKFKGDPLEYKRFMRQFKARVVANTVDDDERMNYLEQFTEGEPHHIVNGYSCLPADVGYPAALKEMEKRYGDVDLLANTYVQRALGWPEIRPDNPSGLDAFAIFLVEC